MAVLQIVQQQYCWEPTGTSEIASDAPGTPVRGTAAEPARRPVA